MPITTPVQLALAKRVSAHLHAHPEQHDQYEYYTETECGTTACVAGWTAILDGADPIRRSYDEYGRAFSISEYSQEALGLDDDEANALFHEIMDPVRARTYLEELIVAGERAEGGER